MTINQKMEGSKLTLNIVGRLDTTTVPELEELLKTALEGVKELVWDFEGMEYISSAGLRVLLSAQKTMNRQGSMCLCHVAEAVMEVLEITGFSEILTIK